MKKLLLILLLTTAHFLVSAQAKKGVGAVKTGSSQVQAKKNYNSAHISSVFDTIKHAICINKQLSVVFYIVVDSLDPSNPNYNGQGYATPARIDTMMFHLNLAFKPICVSFAKCSLVYIPNYTYGKSWIKDYNPYQPIESFVTANYYTDKTINFYLVDTIFPESIKPERSGYSYMPTAANIATNKKDIVVMEKRTLLQAANTTAIHLMGHYFGLPNTFDEISTAAVTPPAPVPIVSNEFANGSNCYTHGDGFCDTDADPENSVVVNGLQDGMGNYYVLPIDNFMSFYTQRSRFTQEQYNRMAYHITVTRLYLH